MARGHIDIDTVLWSSSKLYTTLDFLFSVRDLNLPAILAMTYPQPLFAISNIDLQNRRWLIAKTNSCWLCQKKWRVVKPMNTKRDEWDQYFIIPYIFRTWLNMTAHCYILFNICGILSTFLRGKICSGNIC